MTDEWIKTWYIRIRWNTIQPFKKIMPFAGTWMDLEMITLSEIRQRMKNVTEYQLKVESKL